MEDVVKFLFIAAVIVIGIARQYKKEAQKKEAADTPPGMPPVPEAADAGDPLPPPPHHARGRAFHPPLCPRPTGSPPTAPRSKACSRRTQAAHPPCRREC